MAPRQAHVEKELSEYADASNEKETTEVKPMQLHKGTLVLDLGNYSASAIPLVTFITIFLMSLCSVLPYPRHIANKGMFLLDNMPFMFSLVIVYILFCTVWGPRMMKNRDAIKMKSVIKYYNIFQVVICSYMFYEFCIAGWLTGYSFTCEPLKYTMEPKEVRMASAIYVYYLTKVIDLLDTVFFVLNKKWENISVLHLVHHSTMVLNLFFVALYMPRGQMSFSALFNSFIHICMYGYYFLASLGPAVRPFLWWKKYLTMLQMIQLASIFFHLGQVFINGCDVIPGMIITSMVCSIVYLLLFLDFYFNAYNKKTIKAKVNSAIKENGRPNKDSSSPMYVQSKNFTDMASTASGLGTNVGCWQSLKLL